MTKLCVAYNDGFSLHDAGPDHPESASRVTAVMQVLSEAPLAKSIEVRGSRAATPEEISVAHNPKYVDAIRRLGDAGGQYLASMEANIERYSYDGAIFSAGAGLTLADEIIGGDFQIGFSPNRPPGHHAVWERPKGFCIFNNIVILARYLQNKHGINRIGIIDFDVHHGNGTEEAFWHDENVLFCSLHRENLFPYGKGLTVDTGSGSADGFTINIPLPKGSTDDDYRRVFIDKVLPMYLKFDPDFLLVSAGFDAHESDNIGGMRLTEDGYKQIGEFIRQISLKCTDGMVISLLEGGYHKMALTCGVRGYLSGLIEI